MTTEIQKAARSTQLIATDAGIAWLEQNEDLVPQVAEVMQTAGFGSVGRIDYPKVGSGMYSYVYEFPGNKDVCVKLSDPAASKAAWKTGTTKGTSENLLVQTMFMDLLKNRLDHTRAQSGHSIYAPSQYLAAAFRGNVFVSIQQRVPDQYVNFSEYIDEVDPEMGEKFDMYKRVSERVKKAVGSRLLLRALDDWYVGGVVHRGNVLADKTDPAIDKTGMFLLDMPNRRLKTARAILKLPKSLLVS